ncbi:hypothetical protein B0I35DRAFT_407053 [Stachybotrys elegans]|uniref:Uncharacterized protein n=1 Tax=Stachybotrys elegans TaxID=80388 RepID=A0A8K0SU40_9HYPO|nr:hypothetical protein B0I35DRAFT_407053 [Stachybotrys elegans]
MAAYTMAPNMEHPRQSVDVGERYDSYPFPQPIQSPPTHYRHPSDEEKLLPRVSRPRAAGQEAALLETSFFRTLMSFSWLIHVIAVGCTAAAVQMTFRNVYWADEADWNQRFLWSILRGTRIQDILQFAAKLYEIIIVTSLSAMVMHVLRRMLVGDGIAWGLLSGAYQVGAPGYLFSRQLWSPLAKPSRKGNFFMALGLAILVVYANTVGPFCAIIISPVLEWWPVADPYNGQSLTTHIMALPEQVYKQVLSGNDFAGSDSDEDSCQNFGVANCPDSAFRDIKELLEAWADSNAKPSTQIKLNGAETAKELVSSLSFSTANEHLALSTTLHSSVVELVGAFWNFIDTDSTKRNVNEVKRPRFYPEKDDVYAPLVQVQCSQYTYSELRESNETPSFHMSRMRNFSSYYSPGTEDSYKKRARWDVPSELWDLDRVNLNETTFTWVDVGALADSGQPSIGALLSVPVLTPVNGEEIQDSLLLPCMIDARWAGSKMTYDPKTDNLIPNNLTDLQALAPYWENSNSRPGSLVRPNIHITQEWAQNYLNHELGDADNFSGRAMPWLLDAFINWRSRDDTLSFQTSNYTSTVSARQRNNEAARAVATVLALAISEGVSRSSLMTDIGMILDTIDADAVLWKPLYLQASSEFSRPRDMLLSDIRGRYYPINWKVERRGWGYGFRTPTILGGVIILLAHAGLVVAFSVYVLWFRLRSHGWASGAWGGLSEMLALALSSRKPRDHQTLGELVAGGNKWQTMRTNVSVRTFNQEEVELVFDNIRGLPEAGTGSRLTIGRAYSN